MKRFGLMMILLGTALFVAGLLACSPGDDDDGVNIVVSDDDDDGGGCISCATTSECTASMGKGWACVGGCCENIGGSGTADDDDDSGGDDDDDGAPDGDDDGGSDDDDDTVPDGTVGRFCNALSSQSGPIANTLYLGDVTFADVMSGECTSCRSIPEGSNINAELWWDDLLLVSGVLEVDPAEGSEWIFFSDLEGSEPLLMWGPYSCSDSVWE